MWHIVLTFVLTSLALSTAVNVYAFSAGSSTSIAQRMSPRETNTCESRETPGPICETCELLSTCIRNSRGWMNIPVETCDTQNGLYCNSRLGMCSNMTGPCHPIAVGGSFPCTSLGIFPDPYDCQKYHICYFTSNTLISATLDCDADKAFNAATGQCSLSLQDQVCQQKQFQCIQAGEMHAWPTNPNIFYICKALTNQNESKLYPSLYRCGDREVFDEYYCRDTGTPLPTTSTTVDPDDPWNPNTGSTTAAPSNRCSEAGLIADTEDCHRYYYCSGVNGVMTHRLCPSDTYYNVNFSSCVVGQCAN